MDLAVSVHLEWVKRIFERIVRWKNWPDIGLLILRVGFGLGMAWHGWKKIGGDMGSFTERVDELGFPLAFIWAWAAALGELFGGLLMAAGWWTRQASAVIASIMVVAAFWVHAGDPFKRKELALAYLVVSVCLVLTGPGRYALEGLSVRFRRT